MKSDDLARQLEFYSNAIIGFITIQGIGFSYQFGTSRPFNAILAGNRLLSLALCIGHLVVASMGVYANNFIKYNLMTIYKENHEIINKIYNFKTLIIIFFGLMPFFLLLIFGVLHPHKP